MIATLKTDPAATAHRLPRIPLREVEPQSTVTAMTQAGAPLLEERGTSPYRIVLCCSRDQEHD